MPYCRNRMHYIQNSCTTALIGRKKVYRAVLETWQRFLHNHRNEVIAYPHRHSSADILYSLYSNEDHRTDFHFLLSAWKLYSLSSNRSNRALLTFPTASRILDKKIPACRPSERIMATGLTSSPANYVQKDFLQWYVWRWVRKCHINHPVRDS